MTFGNARIAAAGTDLTLNFEDEARRYHVWLTEDGSVRREWSGVCTVHSNALKETGNHRMDYRTYDADSKRWTAIIGRIFASLDMTAEMARVRVDREAKMKKEENERVAAVRFNRVTENAFALLAALQSMADGDAGAVDGARELIARLEA